MLLILFWIVVGLLAGMTTLQVAYVWRYRRFLRSGADASSTPTPDSFAPNTAVILCVRGEDPTLFECLTGLGLQTYSNFELHVVADVEDDPGLDLVKEFFNDEQFSKNRPTFHVFSKHPASRTLKCSALIHVIHSLKPSVEVVALIDADVVADPHWLSDLVRPLVASDVGASTGNRWFAPTGKNMGSLVRQAWNSGAVPQMIQYNIPWGGTLAIKRTTIAECGLLEAWSTAFCEDTMLTSELKKQNLKVVRVPNLIAANGESTTWKNTTAWISRQLLTVRLHHKNWPLVVIHGIFAAISFLAPIIAGVILLVMGKILLGLIAFAILLLYQLINMGLIEWVRNGNEKVIVDRGSPLNQPSQSLGSKFLTAMATQYTYVLAVFKTVFAKSVTWRGIEYLIKPGRTIEMKQYWPYRDISNGATAADDASID